jgi:ComF family protein
MFKDYLSRIINIIYPKTCLTCRKPLENSRKENLLCSNCLQGIKKNTPPLCTVCGRQIRGIQVPKGLCYACSANKNFSFDRSFAACIYEGEIRELIHRFKYQQQDYLNRFLAGLLIEFVYQNRISLDIFNLVMPIPLHKTRLREREFNQAELIARPLAKEFSLRLSSDNLWRKHNRVAQMELSDKQRWDNVKGCFALRNPQEVRGKNILLIDDVLTTGATSSEAAGVLKTAGAGSVWVLSLAN